MPRGPLPNAQKRHQDPVIPTHHLPPEGRKGKAPKCPYELGEIGQTWWAWAWKLPQATRWDKGCLYALGRRASLEDDLAAIGEFDSLDLADYLSLDESQYEACKRLEYVLQRVRRVAGNSVTIMREMRELDNKFGLNAKAMLDLRWSIGTGVQSSTTSQPVASEPPRLHAVDAKAG